MSPMSQRLLKPVASSFHPEALDWRARVIANSGTVTPSTLRAVSQFCAAVQAAGIRSRFYRLNLLCGGNLNAALVPLYNSTALGGSVLGNTTDTNTGFVSGEYADTGVDGGIGKSAATAKSLATGLTTSNLPQFATAHVAACLKEGSVGSSGGFLLGDNAGTDKHFVYVQHSGGFVAWNAQLAASGGDVSYVNALASSGRFLASRTSNTLITTYRNGSSVATNTSAANPTAAGKALNFFTQTGMLGRLYYYSLGDSLSGSEQATLDGIFSAYLTAMGRV